MINGKLTSAVLQELVLESIWAAKSKDAHIKFGMSYYSTNNFVRFFKIKKVNEKMYYSLEKNVKTYLLMEIDVCFFLATIISSERLCA
jgi:hypothetical protein